MAPNETGATNFRPPSFDPVTGLFVVSAADGYGLYFYKQDHGAYGWAGADYDVWTRGPIRAIDYRTGKVRWSHDIGEGAGAAGVLNHSQWSDIYRRCRRERAGAAYQRWHDTLACHVRA